MILSEKRFAYSLGVLFAALGFFVLSTTTVLAASCPVTDGGAGDGDSTVNGTITISANTTWSPSDGTAFDCTGVDILVTSNSTLTINGDTANGYIGQINTDNLQIDSGSYISANEEGCQGTDGNGAGPNTSTNVCSTGTTGAGAGLASAYGAGGASYAGAGGNGTDGAAGTVYGSPTAPTLFGSGGGSATVNAYGGYGGGVIRIDISGTFTHNGILTANGGDGNTNGTDRSGGGGSGGSIYITTDTITGSGTFSAAGGDGGNGSSKDGGGGGGGRIVLKYNTSSFSFDSTDFDVSGGSSDANNGAKGTVYLEDIDSNAVEVYHGFDYDDTDYSETSWVIDSSATNQYCDSGTATPSISAGTIVMAGTIDCNADITSFNWSATTSFTIAASTSFSMWDRGGVVDFNIPAGNDQTWSGVTIFVQTEGYLTIDDAIDITLSDSTAITANAQFTNLTGFTMDSGTTISANEIGCRISSDEGYGPNTSTNVCGDALSGAGDGNATDFGASGGSYGNYAGSGTNGAVANPYGSPTAPVLFGSAGGSATTSYDGGKGGGYIRIDSSGTVTLNGGITANGGNAETNGTTRSGGGGSGGSIYITTDAIAGSGTFAATGGNAGDGSTRDGGGGSGGRIAIKYNTSTFSFDNTDFDVSGGSSDGYDGGTGTVYVEDIDGNAVTIYHGFDYDNTDYSETSWTIDSSADAQYCAPSSSTPSVTAGTISIAGTIDCDASISSFNWSASTSFDIASGTSITLSDNGADMDFDIPDGDDQTWSNVTINGPAYGFLTIDDAIDITLSSSTDILMNVQFTNLTGFTMDSGTTINANSLGCLNNGNDDGYGPDVSNVCTKLTAGYGDGLAITGRGAQGAGHGGAGGDGDDLSAAGSTYGSETAPVLLGSSGGSVTTNAKGGAGGGLIQIALAEGTFTLNGALSVDGGNGNVSGSSAAGAGSGGSIYLIAPAVISGSTGTLSADGGDGADGGTNFGGGGGGGRIRVEYGKDSTTFLSGLAASSVAIGGTGPGTATDGADGTLSVADAYGPTMSSAITADTDADGQIDQISIVLTEDVDAGTVAGSDFSISDSYVISSASRAGSALININITESGSADTGATPTVTIAGSIDDSSANSTTSGSIVSTDQAPPVLLSTSPEDGDAGVASDEDVVLTFSEAMSTGTVTYSFDSAPSGISTAWTSGDTVLTISHTGVFGSGRTIVFEVTAAEDPSGNSFVEVATNPMSFRIQSSGSSTPPPAPTTYGITLSLSLTGTNVLVSWQSTGNGNIGYADVYQRYSENDEWTLIADDVDFYDGERTWEITDATQPSSAFRIAGHDLSTTVATAEASIDLNTGTVTEDETTNDQTDGETTYAPSPVTGELEAVSDVSAGMYIKGSSYSTVYYIDQDMKRRPFMDAQTFFTYQDDFSAVVTVTDATLPTLTLGGPMLPKAGIVLIKVQSDPKVYALTQDDDGNTVLHWIPSEEVAAFLYSEVWADYVIDIPATFWSRFTTGNAYTGSEIVDRNSMKTRAVLNR